MNTASTFGDGTGGAGALVASPIWRLEAVPPNNYSRSSYLAQAYATAERYGEAADTLLAMPQGVFTQRSVEDASRLLRGALAKNNSPEELPILEGELNFVYAQIGAMDRVMEYPERLLELGIELPVHPEQRLERCELLDNSLYTDDSASLRGLKFQNKAKLSS